MIVHAILRIGITRALNESVGRLLGPPHSTGKTTVTSIVRTAAKTWNRYIQVPHLTQDTTWEIDKNRSKHHKQEPRGQPFPNLYITLVTESYKYIVQKTMESITHLLIKNQVSMTRKCHNHTLQTNPQHCEEINNNRKPPGRQTK